MVKRRAARLGDVVGGGVPNLITIKDDEATVQSHSAIVLPGEVEWFEVLNTHGQWKNGEWGTFPPSYGNATLGDAVFRAGSLTAAPFNGFWPQHASLGNNGPAQQHFLDEGVFLPRGYPFARGECEGIVTTHATVQPLFHIEFHPNSNVWQLFVADPANLYNQLGEQGNPKLLVPAGIASKGFAARWAVISYQDPTTGLWAQRYELEVMINSLITHTITAGNGAGVTAIALPFRGYTNIIKTAGANGTWDPYAASVNLAVRFALYRVTGETGDGSSLLDIRSARAWAGRRRA